MIYQQSAVSVWLAGHRQRGWCWDAWLYVLLLPLQHGPSPTQTSRVKRPRLTGLCPHSHSSLEIHSTWESWIISLTTLWRPETKICWRRNACSISASCSPSWLLVESGTAHQQQSQGLFDKFCFSTAVYQFSQEMSGLKESVSTLSWVRNLLCWCLLFHG